MTARDTVPPAPTNTILYPLDPEAMRPAGRFYFLPARHWAFIVVVATLVATAAAARYQYDSPWVGLGIWFTIVVGLHTAFIARLVPWIPGVIVLVATLQWVLSSWAAYHVPPPLYTLAMAVPSGDYFSYAVPATGLFILGIYLPLWSLGRRPAQRTILMPPADFARTCDIMIVIGVVATVVQNVDVVPYALRYAVLLIEYLSFVGAFGLALARAEGWGWRLGTVLALRVLLSTNDGTFQELLLWVAYSLVVLAFLLRWRARTLVVLSAGGLIALGAMNQIKLDYRVWLAENPEVSLNDRVEAMGQALGNQLAEPLGPFSGEALSRTVARVNQGWIISRVMYWTPSREPYAEGETLIAALRAVVMPRVLDPNKYVAGGSYFTRFTGVSLRGGTSMNLSPPGEMYANFGASGGLTGVFLFALGLGLLYGMFARWAMDSILWWAWAPYVMLYTMQAETGIGEAVNHVARSLLVMVVVVWVVPAWKSLRRWQPLIRRVRALRRARLLAFPGIRSHGP